MRTPSRLVALLALVAMHVALYYVVNTASLAWPESALHDFSIPLDDRIPFLPWTWILYYLGDLYILGFAGWVMFQLSPAPFRRALLAYAGMIVVAAIVQLAVPARAPWPDAFTTAQAWGHRATGMHAFATLPSMHVALSVLPALLSLSVLRRPGLKALSVLAAVLISISTLTLKEHVVLDAAAGVLLAVAAWRYWRFGSDDDSRLAPVTSKPS